MNKKIKKTAFCSIISALSCALIILGTYFEILDLTVSTFCSFAVLVALSEAGYKFAFLTYLTTSVLCLILSPISTSVLYYICIFGYFPILARLLKNTNKYLSKAIKFVVFNGVMVLLFIVFAKVFTFEDAPKSFYIILLITSNIFFFCYDYALKIFEIIYIKKLKNRLKLKL